MLEKLALENFRGFRDFEMPFAANTLIVGKNNAGKSTVVEALRIVSLVLERAKTAKYCDVPSWLDIPKINRGIQPDLKQLDINFKSLFHKLEDPPAIIRAFFSDGIRVNVYLAVEKIFAILQDSAGKVITERSMAAKIELPPVRILPQIGPLHNAEVLLDPAYVRRLYSSSLASLHFRNQISINYKEFFAEFEELVSSTWPGPMRIEKFEGRNAMPKEPLYLYVRDGSFVAEVAWLGHGLQMWLQIMWFLSSVDRKATVILDEPDVYMHMELQRKLIRLLKNRFNQVLIATHSTEFLTEASHDEILIVDRAKQRANFASSLPGVQSIIDQLGGNSNVTLARLWVAKRMLLVEGQDVEMLRLLHGILFPKSDPLDTLPSMSYGGWGGWSYAIGTGMMLKNAAKDNIIPYCLMDRDYHTDEEIAARLKDAMERGIQLHVWNRKELENYFIIPSAISRVLCREGAEVPTNGLTKMIEQFCEEMKQDTFDALASAFQLTRRGVTVSMANSQARTKLADAWGTFEGKIAIVSGKALLGKVSSWTQKEFKVTLTKMKITKECKPSDLSVELREILRKIDQSQLLK